MKPVFKHTLLQVLFLAGMVLPYSCLKKDFLDVKSSTALVVPTTINDFQALLNNTYVMNITPVLGELATDDYYLPYDFWRGLNAKERNAYIWAPDLYEGKGDVDDWDIPYQAVFYANIVLEGLDRLPADQGKQVLADNTRGAALFYRSYAFYNLACTFAPAYDSATADTDAGIPLRLHSDVNQLLPRSTIRQTYTQLLEDLHAAVNLLPATVPAANLNRPSRPAAFALLARIYLAMGIYDKAGMYADSCLQLYNRLIDYNTISTIANFPFSRFNEETLFETNPASTSVLYAFVYPQCRIDTVLYGLYGAHDLRRSIYFRKSSPGNFNIKGGYNETVFGFSGLAIDEVYLIRAESYARSGNTDLAMKDLNTLLEKRFETGTFLPLSANTTEEALRLVLLERRKELIWRGLRFTDLKRLNKEGYGIVLTRMLNGQLYYLPAGSPLYTMPIPPDEIALSGITQNKR